MQLVAAELAVDKGDFPGTLIVILDQATLEPAMFPESFELIVEGHHASRWIGLQNRSFISKGIDSTPGILGMARRLVQVNKKLRRSLPSFT
jgi:hypothetical protein